MVDVVLGIGFCVTEDNREGGGVSDWGSESDADGEVRGDEESFRVEDGFAASILESEG